MAKSADEVFRDHVKFGTGHPLPIGDPRSGVHIPSKYDFREWAKGVEDAVTEAAPVEAIGPYIVSPRGEGGFYQVQYSSGRTDANIFGYTANVTRTGGSRHAVAAQLNAYDRSPGGTTPGSVFGAAIEAWTGSHDLAPAVAATLIGIEPSIIQQRHDSESGKRGIDVVFKNRKDGGTLLHGSIGGNKYNKGAIGISITSQSRSAAGEYCGWNKGIWFSADSLDMDTTGGAIAIDLRPVNVNRMEYGIAIGQDVSIGFSGNHATRDFKLRYSSELDGLQIMNGQTSLFSLGYESGTLGIHVQGLRVVRGRRTGWGAMAGTATRSGGDTASITTAQLAQRVKALIDDLMAHGLIGA